MKKKNQFKLIKKAILGIGGSVVVLVTSLLGCNITKGNEKPQPSKDIEPSDSYEVDNSKEPTISDYITFEPIESDEVIESQNIDESPIPSIREDLDTLSPSEEPSLSPSKDIESSKPENTTKPKESNKPIIETSKPVESIKPSKPVETTKPEESIKPSNPIETTKPEESINPSNPVETTKPEESINPSNPVETTKPEESAKPSNPVETTKPEESAKPSEPVESSKPEESKPVEPTQPDYRPHYHSWSDWKSVNDDYEEQVCNGCGATLQRSHEYVYDNTENVSNNNGTYTEILNEKCSYCGHTRRMLSVKNCVFDEWKYNQHTGREERTCQVTGYTESREHNHTFGNYKYNPDTQKEEATCSSCGTVSQKEHTHTFGDYKYNPATQKEEATCPTCGTVSQKEHTHTLREYNYNPSSRMDEATCDVCGTVVQKTHEHDYNTFKSCDDNFEYWECVCKEEKQKEHNYQDNVCQNPECGHEKTPTHEHTRTYKKGDIKDYPQFSDEEYCYVDVYYCSECSQELEVTPVKHQVYLYGTDSWGELWLCSNCSKDFDHNPYASNDIYLNNNLDNEIYTRARIKRGMY